MYHLKNVKLYSEVQNLCRHFTCALVWSRLKALIWKALISKAVICKALICKAIICNAFWTTCLWESLVAIAISRFIAFEHWVIKLKLLTYERTKFKNKYYTLADNWCVSNLRRFQELVYSEGLDVVLVSETWLNDSIRDSEILSDGCTTSLE